MAELPPVRREVIVAADPDVAFDIFCTHLGDWWPIHTHGVYCDGTVALANGQIVETAADGRRALWGTVTTWERPRQVAFTWHPGRDAQQATRVSVTFSAVEGGRTLVQLSHQGWEMYADPAAARAEYEGGWTPVLDRYAEHTEHRAAGVA